MYLAIHDKDYLGWTTIISSVQQKYKQAYDATILVQPEYFIAAYKDQDLTNLMGCAGLKFADKGKLFSEQYLDQPIETILETFLNKMVSRDEIVEIGSLTSVSGGVGSLIVKKTPFLSKCLGAKYLLCTVTKDVRKLMSFHNIIFNKICESNVENINLTDESWGSYYNNYPETGYIVIDDSIQKELSKKIIFSTKKIA